ncbi:Gfo/Idh/MocA family protein [Aeromicrobium chenweiae]|uniref:Oxidoreductase n=1 Tax=Aeromicrobium chenweiae TaxID=2079793 RepID=A0A2S0WIZ5_9ACTN|nr:Gfo/Idh/MocA family oxidoreductase [Aeromicrobium chenweiae]AWB91308.1 oxidoreductase [Aeromicrobium chenweiae]TGN30566.1 Gfo/Idh/MocA family oxidoreductase [Aeromicrobium chenweiae]
MTTRWGILATGAIATSFATDLALVPDNELVAVGSRRPDAATEFADRFGATRAHGSYEELAADPDVDVVYVATPHSRHLEDVRMCFEAGKAVLCEKALTLNARDSADLVAEARDRGLFFAEAMWMRTNPIIRRLTGLVADGAVGTVSQVRAELGFAAPTDNPRLWDPALGASALLDVGIYPLTFAHLLLGEPVDIAAGGVLSDQGIDVNGGAVLTYASGAVATIAWTQLAWGDNRASVAGDAGRIELPGRFHHPSELTVVHDDQPVTVSEAVTGRGYAHEIEEVAACLRDGRTESTLLPLDETVSIQRQMDDILSQLGVAER